MFNRRLSWIPALALFGAVATGCGHGHAPSNVASPQATGIAVSGVGEVTAAPDVARIRMGVRGYGPDVTTATSEVGRRIDAVIAALSEQGVAERDLVTRDVSVYEDHREPRPLPADSARPTQPRAFVASNILEVTVRDLEAMDRLLAVATKSGVNQMHGISFELEDRTAADDEALASAMAMAEARARRLAELSGRELGEVVRVEISDAATPTFPMARMAMAESADGFMPVEPGEFTVRRSVSVHYAWKD